MPLSEHERKLLAEMEAAFAQEDPRLVSTLTGKARTKQASRVFYGAIALVLGLATLFGGLISKVIAIGLVGFLIALAGTFFIASNFGAILSGGVAGLKGSLQKGAAKKPQPKKSFAQRLEERWERRNFDR
jgi:hypothetical protein